MRTGKRGKAILQRLHVLEGEHRGRREKRDLLAVHRRLERGAHGDLGLAVADVAAQQPIHRRRRFHVALDVGDRRALIRRQLPLEGVLELLLPVGVGAEGVTRHRLARGVELEQLLGHVAHGLLDARLGLLPGRAAQAIERRPGRAGVLLNEIEPLDGDEQLVFAGVAKLHELLRLEPDVDPLESDEDADAVVDVDDEVAGLEVAEVRQERARRRLAALVDFPLFLEDVGLGPELELCFRQPEAAAEMPDADQDGRRVRVLGALHRRGVDLVVGEELNRPLGAARRVRDEDHRVAALAAAADLLDPVLHAPGELDRRLTADVDRPWAVVGERERLERRRSLEPRARRVPVDQQLARPRHALTLLDGFVVAAPGPAPTASGRARALRPVPTRSTIGRTVER